MTKITTVRAALHAIASEGLNTRGLFQLGSAMGPANLYLAGVDAPAGFEPIRRTDSAGRSWLMAFTVPNPSCLVGTADSQVRYQEITGAALLRLASGEGSCLVLEANLPLECRIPPRATQSLQVAAGYTEALVSSGAAASATPTRSTRRPSVRPWLGSFSPPEDRQWVEGPADGYVKRRSDARPGECRTRRAG